MIGTMINFIVAQFFKFFIIKVILQLLIDIDVKEELSSIVNSIKFLLIFDDLLSVRIKIGILFYTIIIINDVFI